MRSGSASAYCAKSQGGRIPHADELTGKAAPAATYDLDECMQIVMTYAWVAELDQVRKSLHALDDG